MLSLIAAVVVSKAPGAWYGPVTVISPLNTVGDPYDPDVNDVTVDFVADNGEKVHRLAYFIGNGKFAATLVAPTPGRYTPHFLLNGKDVADLDPVEVKNKLPHGFIGLKGNRFAWTDGTPYFPIGYDYAWRAVPNETVAQGMTKMGATGANWSRIWTNHWDNKNPFWPAEGGTKIPGRELRQEPLQNWDQIVAAAEKAGVSFQWVLFHHGPYSTTTDSNWKEHPWNTANGGFLADPTDFFTNPEAKRRSKIWLHYAVARYASSPAVMSWEIFNEVQWVDAIKKNPSRVGDVAAWHHEMIAYVKSLDPYHHLVTSSSSESLDSGVFDDVDYLQPHTYPSNVLASIGGYEFKKKPGFFGEFGPPGAPGPNYNKQVRDGIYGGILAGHAGSGMYWFWDLVDRANLGPSFLAAREVIDQSGLLTHAGAKPWEISTATPRSTVLRVSAGGGWAKSTITELDLPSVDVRKLGGWSPYFQSLDGSNKAWAAPFVVKFVAKQAGKLSINVGEVSASGGTLVVWVNDQKAFDQQYEPATRGAGSPRRTQRPPVLIDYPAGPVVVRLENHGKDWIRLDAISVPNLAPTASAHGMGDRNWALVRVFGSDTTDVTLSGLGLRDGRYSAKVFDTTNGKVAKQTLEVNHGTVRALALPSDAVIAFSR